MIHNEQIAGTAQIELTQRQIDLIARLFGYFEINMEFDSAAKRWIDGGKVIAAMSQETKRELDQLTLSFKILSTFSK